MHVFVHIINAVYKPIEDSLMKGDCRIDFVFSKDATNLFTVVSYTYVV